MMRNDERIRSEYDRTRYEFRCSRCKALVAYVNTLAFVPWEFNVECLACASEHDLLRELLRTGGDAEYGIPTTSPAGLCSRYSDATQTRRSDLRTYFRLLNDAERVNNGGKNDSS